MSKRLRIIFVLLFLFIAGFLTSAAVDNYFVTIKSFMVPAYYSRIELSNSNSLVCNELVSSLVSEKDLRSIDKPMISAGIRKAENHMESLTVSKLADGYKLNFKNAQQVIQTDDIEQNKDHLYIRYRQIISDVASSEATLVINQSTGYAILSRVSSIQRQGEIVEAHQTLFSCK